MAKRKVKLPVERNPLHRTLAARPNGTMGKTKKALRKREKQMFQKRVKNGGDDDCRYVEQRTGNRKCSGRAGVCARSIQYFRNHLAIQTR